MPDARRPTPIVPPRMGLVAAASTSDSEVVNGGGRWGMGVTWRPELIGDGTDAMGVMPLRCNLSALGRTDRPVLEEAYPFTVFARDSCGTMDDADTADPRDRAARARRLLAATRSASIAKEFWSGALSTAESLANTWLKKSGSVAVTAAAVAPEKALAKLDMAVATNLSNGRGMLHMTVETLDRCAVNNAIRREGNLWLTPFDNICVADAGYDGTGPAAGVWMIATTPVEILFGPVRANDTPAEVFDRTLNDVDVWAFQDVIVFHEPHLLWHRAQVDLA